MAATMIAFPRKPCNAPHQSLHPSLAATEASFDLPSIGPNSASPSTESVSTPQLVTPLPALALPAQVDIAVAQVDREVAHYNARHRLLRLMIEKHGSVTEPL